MFLVFQNQLLSHLVHEIKLIVTDSNQHLTEEQIKWVFDNNLGTIFRIYMSLVTRKSVFGVCNQVRHKAACASSEAR